MRTKIVSLALLFTLSALSFVRSAHADESLRSARGMKVTGAVFVAFGLAQIVAATAMASYDMAGSAACEARSDSCMGGGLFTAFYAAPLFANAAIMLAIGTPLLVSGVHKERVFLRNVSFSAAPIKTGSNFTGATTGATIRF